MAEEQVTKPTGPLSGFRILDMSSVIMGPLATQILADFGAEVIMVEAVGGGLNRNMDRASIHQGLPGTAINLLRNKRSVAVDLKDPEIRAAILALSCDCDAVVSNLLPKSLAGLGLTYEDFAKVNPRIVMCNAQGFRSDSTRPNAPAYDDIIQAESGAVDAARRATGEPTVMPTLLADKVCGMAIVNAVLAALLHRERTGRGQKVEVPMLDVMQAFMLVEHGGEAIRNFDAPAGYNRVLTSGRGPQRTQDGVINIMPYCTANFDDLFAIGGRPDLVGSEKFATFGAILENNRFLSDEVRKVVAERRTDEWLEICAAKRIPVGKVPTLEEILAGLPVEIHPVAGPYRHIPPPIVFSGTPCSLRSHAQLVGEATQAVLLEAGLTTAEIDSLIERGAARIA